MPVRFISALFALVMLTPACGNSEFKNSQAGAVAEKDESSATSTDSTSTEDLDNPELNTGDAESKVKIKKKAKRTIASCSSADDIVEAGGSISLQFANANSDEVYTVILEDKSVGPGSVEKTATIGNVTFKAPASLASDSFVFVKADSSGSDENKYCRIGLARAGSLAISSGSSSRLRLPIAKVFQLPNLTKNLPNYATMTPVQTLKYKDINVPGREFTLGFPGVNNLIEYFGIQYNFNLVIPTSGVYEFHISSDDGSRLYINNVMVADLDGWAKSSRGAFRTGSANLTAGTIAGRVDYFQGPGNGLAMTLMWKKPGDLNFVPIPPSAFKP